MITLIGTGHVFNLSQPLLNILDEKNPEVICIELDKKRYHAIIAKNKDPKSYEKNRKNAPFIYKLLARFQDSMAKQYGVQPGDEMLTAINYAQSHQIPLKLIDMDAQRLFSKMLKSMSFSEKFKLFLSGIGGFFISRKQVEKELKKVENEFDKYIEEISEKFPTIKKILIDDRNLFMKKKLKDLSQDYEKIIVCIGDGHIPGISLLLKSDGVDFETIRLNELRKNEKKFDNNTSGYFTAEYKTY